MKFELFSVPRVIVWDGSSVKLQVVTPLLHPLGSGSSTTSIPDVPQFGDGPSTTASYLVLGSYLILFGWFGDDLEYN